MNNHPSRVTDYLLAKMWKTKSARFNAYARLRTRHWASIAATSLLSLYVVASSLGQIAFDDALSATDNKLLSLVNVVVSVFVIIVTLLETARNYQGEGERMRESALRIAALYNRFQALTIDKANAERLAYNDLYSEALQAIPVDHKEIDRKRFMLRSAADLGIKRAAYAGLVVNYAWLWLREFSLYLALVLLPPVAVAVGWLG